MALNSAATLHAAARLTGKGCTWRPPCIKLLHSA
jgi:hypothetical protein